MRDIHREQASTTSGRATLARPLLWGVIALLFIELLLVRHFRWGAIALASGLLGGLLWWLVQ